MFNEIVDFLAPHVTDSGDRHALIDLAFNAYPRLYGKIDFTGNAHAFAARLIHTLRSYGEVEPDVQALWHLLLTLREQVGLDQQRKINSFEPWANKPQGFADDSSNLLASHPSLDKAIYSSAYNQTSRKPPVAQPEKTPTPQTVEEERRLDAAIPRETVVNQPTEVWVQICLPGSRGFRDKLPHVTDDGDIIDQRDVRENCFPITFPLDERTGQPQPISVWIEIEASGFQIRKPLQMVSVRHSADSPLVVFQAIPRVARKRSIIHIVLKSKMPDGSLMTLGTIVLYTHTTQEGIVSQIWSVVSVAMSRLGSKHVLKHSFPGSQNPTTIENHNSVLPRDSESPPYAQLRLPRYFMSILALLVCGFAILPVFLTQRYMPPPPTPTITTMANTEIVLYIDRDMLTIHIPEGIPPEGLERIKELVFVYEALDGPIMMMDLITGNSVSQFIPVIENGGGNCLGYKTAENLPNPSIPEGCEQFSWIQLSSFAAFWYQDNRQTSFTVRAGDEDLGICASSMERCTIDLFPKAQAAHIVIYRDSATFTLRIPENISTGALEQIKGLIFVYQDLSGSIPMKLLNEATASQFIPIIDDGGGNCLGYKTAPNIPNPSIPEGCNEFAFNQLSQFAVFWYRDNQPTSFVVMAGDQQLGLCAANMQRCTIYLLPESLLQVTPTLVLSYMPTDAPTSTLTPTLTSALMATPSTPSPTLLPSSPPDTSSGHSYPLPGENALLQLTSVADTMMDLTNVASIVQPYTTSNSTTSLPTSVPAVPTSDLTANAIDLEQEIARVIHAEAWAVVNEDEETINQIFAPDAIILDRTKGETHRDPAAFYRGKFRTYKFCSVSHYGIRDVEISGDRASATSGSSGMYGFNYQSVCSQSFDNPPPADIWEFERIDGEWKIVSFSFK